MFTAQGHLYLSSDADDTRGINAFRVPEGALVKYVRMDTDFWTIGEEVEGLTFWDLDDGRAPNIQGQLHVLELDVDIDRDDLLAFRHYHVARVQTPEFIANSNPRSLEVHKLTCYWVGKMNPRHKVPYVSLDDALADGYDGCHFCLPEHDTG